MPIHDRTWWGAPKKFSLHIAERKISWLELFYDLVYVIVISRTTHILVLYHDMPGIVNYIYLFSIIFWGWVNGSQYYDLHGSPGVRTRFMMLWQMIAVAALAVSLSSPVAQFMLRTTASIAFLQGFITYLWWSVGIYDKEHRKLNVPYTVCYLLSLGLIIGSLFVDQRFITGFFIAALVLNYLPPFLVVLRSPERSMQLSVSTSMTERLGLMVIIVFGEAILGVINSISDKSNIPADVWLCFGMGILILFGMWWVFFGLIADRECRPGFAMGTAMILLYIPAISSLGMAGASFPALIAGGADTMWARIMYGSSISVFLLCISLISGFLKYPEHYQPHKRSMRLIVAGAGILVAIVSTGLVYASLLPYLAICFGIVLIVVVISTSMWARLEGSKATK